ncbi:MAG: MBL fold metallo-hydrolase [Dysgonamonadaceae bacterium]|jgi:metallo-beta-lactamase family protein|nr:MBL fold metallo-hydrolase [Dysgonamonadaceae bacterium]
MKIAFHGAARTVTGSKHLVSLNNGKRFLLDCGMFQGKGSETDLLNRTWGFKPEEVDYVFLSHAHVDHSGLLPKLVKDGFKGKIYATPATIDVTKALLLDSAAIQKQDITFLNKKRREEGRKLLEPLYTEDDVRNTFDRFREIDYNRKTRIDDSVEVELFDCGHIIGSATVFLYLRENGKSATLAFSGDVGRYGDPILHSPQTFPHADYIIIESTYGNKLHDKIETYAVDLLKNIRETCLHKKGKLIIPAFSVGRTQELLYSLNDLELDGELPAVKYYVDSPLSVKITEIVKRHSECFNRSVQKLLKNDRDPFYFHGLKYITDKRDSQALNTNFSPSVIISASGMAEAGRVKHHIANSIENWRNTIMMIGYCEPESLGARLKEHPETVGIFGEKYTVKADIVSLNSMSAHADYNDLCQYLSCQDSGEIKRLFIVHGEPEVQDEFKRRLLRKGFRDIDIPRMHQEFGLN